MSNYSKTKELWRTQEILGTSDDRGFLLARGTGKEPQRVSFFETELQETGPGHRTDTASGIDGIVRRKDGCHESGIRFADG